MNINGSILVGSAEAPGTIGNATAGLVSINTTALNVSGLIDASSKSGHGGAINLTAANGISVVGSLDASASIHGGFGGTILIAGGTSGSGDVSVGSITSFGYGSLTSGGNVTIQTPGSVTVTGDIDLSGHQLNFGTSTAFGSDARGGSLLIMAGNNGSTGAVASPGTIGVQNINTSGSTGGNVFLVSMGVINAGTGAEITAGSGTSITTNATIPGSIAGSVMVSSPGAISLGNILATANVPGLRTTIAQGGSVFITSGYTYSGSTPAISIGTIDTSGSDRFGNVFVVGTADANVTPDAYAVTFADGNNPNFIGASASPASSLVGNSTITVNLTPNNLSISGFAAGGFTGVNLTSGQSLNINVIGGTDSRLLVPVIALGGNAAFGSVTTSGAAGVGLFSSGNASVSSLNGSSASSTGSTAAIGTNFGTLTTGSLTVSGFTGGNLFLSAPAGLTLGAVNATGNSSAGSAGGNVIAAVPTGGISFSGVDVSAQAQGGTVHLLSRGNISNGSINANAVTGTAGNINVVAADGVVTLGDAQASSTELNGGYIGITGFVGVTSGGGKLAVNGNLLGGAIRIFSPGGAIDLSSYSEVSAASKDPSGLGVIGIGGQIDVVGNKGLVSVPNLDVTGSSGGNIRVAAGQFTVKNGASLNASGTQNLGGLVSVISIGNLDYTNTNLLAEGGTFGGTILLRSVSGRVNLQSANRVSAKANNPLGIGGQIGLYAEFGAVQSGNLDVSGAQGGSIYVLGSTFQSQPGKQLLADGSSGLGGFISIITTSSTQATDLGDNRFSATGTAGGGVISINATGNVTSNGGNLVVSSTGGSGGIINISSSAGNINLKLNVIWTPDLLMAAEA
jgi:hypothetical protein